MPQDSSRPEFWDERYRGGVMPWDAGGVPPQLARFLETAAPGRVLLPGCGSGYEVRAFLEHGHEVTAIEISEAAIAAAARTLGAFSDRVKKADFFAFDAAPFDLIYERAFLCALPRRLWPEWASRVAELVRPGGALAGFFYLDDNERGPPFGIRTKSSTGCCGAPSCRKKVCASRRRTRSRCSRARRFGSSGGGGYDDGAMRRPC